MERHIAAGLEFSRQAAEFAKSSLPRKRGIPNQAQSFFHPNGPLTTDHGPMTDHSHHNQLLFNHIGKKWRTSTNISAHRPAKHHAASKPRRRRVSDNGWSNLIFSHPPVIANCNL
jgi:hypothetical protein